MSNPPPYPILGIAEAIAGLTALVLAAACTMTEQHNRNLEAQIHDKQVQIAKAESLALLNANLIRLVGTVASERHDQALTEVLARNGLTVDEALKAH